MKKKSLIVRIEFFGLNIYHFTITNKKQTLLFAAFGQLNSWEQQHQQQFF